MKLTLCKLPLDDECDLGVSHILGCPDVPEKWSDEAVFMNDEIFLGQINLSEVNIEGLPTKGILYFFFASESRPYRGIVRYTDDLSTLERIDFNCEVDFKFDLNKEYSVSFSDEKGNIELLSEKTKLKNYSIKNDEVVLFKFNPIEYPELDIFSDIDDVVCYLIKKDDLVNNRFDKAYLSLPIEM